MKRSKKRSTKPQRRKRTAPPQFPRWYKSDKNQAVAEWLAWNYYIDKLAGRAPSPDLEPYSQFKRSTVAAFLAKLDALTANASIIAPQSALLTL